MRLALIRESRKGDHFIMSEPTVKDLKKDMYLIMHKAQEMLELTEDAFMKSKIASIEKADELAKEIYAKEDALTAALAKLAAANPEARTMLSAPAHIEKIATSIKRITENIATRIKEGLLFSDKAIQESGTMFAKSKEVLKKAGEAAVTGTNAEAIRKDADAIIKMADDYATAHEERLVTGECSPKASSTYLCMLYAFEDLASHTKDVVKKMVAK